MTERTARILRVLFFVYVGITFLHVAYVVWCEPYAFDAWNVSVDTGAKEPSLGRFFEFWHQQYTTSNPRIGQPMTYFAYKYAGVAEVGSAAAFLLIVVGGFVVGTGTWPSWRRGRDLATIAIGTGLMWLAAPNFPAYLFCRAYATNYVWTAAILIWFLAAIRMHDPTSKVAPAKIAGVFVLGVICGMGNEHTGPTLVLFTAAYALWTYRQHRTWSPLLVAGAVGTFVGFALIFFAPGQDSRYDDFLKERFTVTEQILVRGFSGNFDILKGMLQAAAPLLVILVAVIAIGMSSENRADAALLEQRGRQRRAIAILALTVIAGILITCTVFASPKLGERFYMHSVLLLLAGFLGVTHAYLHRARAYAPFVVIAVLASIYALVRTVPMYTRLHRDSEQRMAELKAAPLDTIYTATAWESVNETHWFLGDDFRDQKKRELVADYFGLHRVIFRGADVWRTLGVTDVKLVTDYKLDDPTVCLDKIDKLDIPPYVGRDISALHFAFQDAITEIKHALQTPVRSIDLRVTFLGETPPLPRTNVYVARWANGVMEGYVGGVDRIGRTKNREIKLPKELRAQAGWDLYLVRIGDEPRLLGPTNGGKPLTYQPWKTGSYWALACDARACFVISAFHHRI